MISRGCLPDRPLEQFDLHGLVVGDAETAHLSLPLQFVKSLRYLLRFCQRVGAVDEQYVQIVSLQTLQNSVHGAQQVLPGGVVEALADAAFGLEDQVLPADGGIAPDRRAEVFLAGSAAVNVGVVKVIRAAIQRGVDKTSQFLPVQRAQTHTAYDDGGDPPSAAQADVFHDRFLLVVS